ncbi:MAG: DUF4382 domain-containing protein [Nitrososphaerota archaeon]|nr:DUF4382 domain-containing protein [Nitrososphaerota archaeon]
MKTGVTAGIAIVIAAVVIVTAYAITMPGGNGSLAIGVTDSPVSNVSHIYLTISDIQLQGQGNSSVNFKVNSTSFDLLSFVNVTKMLGSESIPAGNYTMIRFTILSATATIGGKNTTLNVPSGQVKVPLSFRIASGKTTTVVIDVTADMTNISASGNLRPVVTVKSVTGPS